MGYPGPIYRIPGYPLRGLPDGVTIDDTTTTTEASSNE
jgi:hypothetical protein